MLSLCNHIFQPTLPARGATGQTYTRRLVNQISTHAPRTGSDRPPPPLETDTQAISTHAPRTGSDRSGCPAGCVRQWISTHAPRTGSDKVRIPREAYCIVFQPTLPARGATHHLRPRHGPHPRHFNPRSPHGERPGPHSTNMNAISFQPTLPARGATTCSTPCARRIANFNPRSPHGERRTTTTDSLFSIAFQPTLPARGATNRLHELLAKLAISTHAPRTGSDGSGGTAGAEAENFNPRSPHGERHTCWMDANTALEFQPTLPARGATPRISPSMLNCTYFNPRSPHGERHDFDTIFTVMMDISTHAPRTGSDYSSGKGLDFFGLFQPTLPARGATQRGPSPRYMEVFQPTLPARGATPRQSCESVGPHISTHAPRTGSDQIKTPSPA